jgi:predicted kinase
MFIIFAGLPGCGKSTIAQALAKRLGAAYLRIDSIEQAISDARIEPGAAGYLVAYRVAADNLRSGLRVIADSMNPLAITRDAYRQVAEQAGVAFLEVELICSDKIEHRRRVETRSATVEGLGLPTWEAVETRQYETWDRGPLRIDTAKLSIAESVEMIVAEIVRMGAERHAPAGEWGKFELRRQSDALVYCFDRRVREDGSIAYKRRDGDYWIVKRRELGWVAWDDATQSSTGRPWNVQPNDQSDHPPEGIWVSRKDSKSYVYSLVYVE